MYSTPRHSYSYFIHVHVTNSNSDYTLRVCVSLFHGVYFSKFLLYFETIICYFLWLYQKFLTLALQSFSSFGKRRKIREGHISTACTVWSTSKQNVCMDYLNWEEKHLLFYLFIIILNVWLFPLMEISLLCTAITQKHGNAIVLPIAFVCPLLYLISSCK